MDDWGKIQRHQPRNWGKIMTSSVQNWGKTMMLSAQKLSENCCPEIENEIAQVLAETVPGLK